MLRRLQRKDEPLALACRHLEDIWKRRYGISCSARGQKTASALLFVVFDNLPRPHFREVRVLAKLSKSPALA